MQKQRARNPAEKEYRKQTIVDALETLLNRELHPLPSANDIARTAGVTKGVIYFYFNTREEIFLTLLLRKGEQVFKTMLAAIQSEPYNHARVRAALVEICSTNTIFMYLSLLAPQILEANVSAEFVREFKLSSQDRIEGIARDMALREPDANLDQCRRFFLRFYYLALSFWQHYHPPAAVLDAFDGERPWILQGDLSRELVECFDWLWAGMRAEVASGGQRQ